MGDLYAIADLHLAHAIDKPMDVFGEVWRDHTSRMARAWDATVESDATVLLGGDLSWARNLKQAERDLQWIGERPGRKLFLRGNHDGWWQSAARVREALPAGCSLLQHDAHDVEGWVVVGARGWLDPADPLATDGDRRLFERELQRLRMSIDDADRKFGTERPRLALVHYPPFMLGSEPTDVVRLLREAGVRICVYGHLHGDDHERAPRGSHHGIEFVFAAGDANDFTPVRLPEPR